MEIKKIIDSGILETYVMGIATAEETEQVMRYKKQYPEVNIALQQIELDLENLAIKNGIEPPVGTFEKIENQINDIELHKRNFLKAVGTDQSYHTYESKSPYLEVQAESSHMRIHKSWRWVFLAVFILGKIFLGLAIYFYLENRQAQQQLIELKQKVNQFK